MELYIREKPAWVNFINSTQDLADFIENYIGQQVCIGDVSQFSSAAIQKLLKFTEENPKVNLYSSTEINCDPLYSRASRVHKTYSLLPEDFDINRFNQGRQSYQECIQDLATLSATEKLLMVGSPRRLKQLILSKPEQW